MLKVRATDNPNQFQIITESNYRRTLNLEEILEHLYSIQNMDLEGIQEQINDLERRIEKIECFCNALSDAVGDLQ